MSVKLSIAEVKRRLKPGTIYTGEFIGRNANHAPPGMKITQRKVVSNKTQIVSEFIDGPKIGQNIYLSWANVTAVESDGSIILTMNEINPPEDFLKVTIADEVLTKSAN